jgi:RNA polymerase sigma-70 factor (ECF subfamily)
LFHWAHAAGLRDADAADLVQDVFVVLLRKLPEFEYDRSGSFRAWLRTVTLNKWRDHVRSRASQPAAVSAETLNELPEPGDGGVFSEIEYRRHLLHRLLELIRPEFQEKTWQAFREHTLEGRPAAAVGADLGMTEGAVYSARFRVMVRLRAELAGLLD